VPGDGEGGCKNSLQKKEKKKNYFVFRATQYKNRYVTVVFSSTTILSFDDFHSFAGYMCLLRCEATPLRLSLAYPTFLYK